MDDRSRSETISEARRPPSIPRRLLGGFADKPVLGISLVVLVLLAVGFLVSLVLFLL